METFKEEINTLRKLRLIIEKSDTDLLLERMGQEEYNKIMERAALIVSDLENRLDAIKKKKWWRH